jgi:hypothetical protein
MAIAKKTEKTKAVPAPRFRIASGKVLEVLPSPPHPTSNGIIEENLHKSLSTGLPVVATDRMLRAFPSDSKQHK